MIAVSCKTGRPNVYSYNDDHPNVVERVGSDSSMSYPGEYTVCLMRPISLAFSVQVQGWILAGPRILDRPLFLSAPIPLAESMLNVLAQADNAVI